MQFSKDSQNRRMLRSSLTSGVNNKLIRKTKESGGFMQPTTKEKKRVKITSYGKLTSFGYNIKTPAIVELYSNQIAILKAGGVVIEEISETK